MNKAAASRGGYTKIKGAILCTQQYCRVRHAELAEIKLQGRLQQVFMKRDFLSRSNASVHPAQAHCFFIIHLTTKSDIRCQATEAGYFELPDHAVLGESNCDYRTSQVWATGPCRFPFCVIEGVREMAIACQYSASSGNGLSTCTVLLGTITGVNAGFDIVESSGKKLLPLDTLQKLFRPQLIDMPARLS